MAAVAVGLRLGCEPVWKQGPAGGGGGPGGLLQQATEKNKKLGASEEAPIDE